MSNMGGGRRLNGSSVRAGSGANNSKNGSGDRGQTRPALPRVLIAGNGSADCDALERILRTVRGFEVVRARTIDSALAELRPDHAGARYFDCCVLARELDGSALEIAEAACEARPEPLLLALESEGWLENERRELEDSGARLLPVPLTPRGMLDLLQRGVLDPVWHWAEQQPLSPRGYQVLSLGYRGAIDPQIATILGLSESTVHDHWRAVCRRTRTGSRWDLIARVARDITKRASWPPLAL